MSDHVRVPTPPQLSPGTEFPKLSLPLSLNEPCTLLDRLSAAFCTCSLLSSVAEMLEPAERIKGIARWLLATVNAMPLSAKLPLLSLKREVFRCAYDLPADGEQPASRAFLLAEQIAPTLVGVVISNRVGGWLVQGGVSLEPVFWGNVAYVRTRGSLSVTLLELGETYTVTLPDVSYSGLFHGAVQAEYTGSAAIHCAQTNHQCELEFLRSPENEPNYVSGTLGCASAPLQLVAGFWNQTVNLLDASGQPVDALFSQSPELISAYPARKVPADPVDMDSSTVGE